MSQAFEADVMEDLFYEAAEGPAAVTRADEWDDLERGEEEFVDAFGEEEFDALDAWDETGAHGAADAMEDAVALALGADDADEFFRRMFQGIRRVAGGIANVARRAAPIVGRIARTVAPIASAIPLPWTQAIGRVAGVVGRLMADEADEFEALDEMFAYAEEEDALDAAAPVIAGLTIRTLMPGVSALPRAARRRLVHSVAQATRGLARRQGPRAARAIPQIVRGVQRAARRRRLPAQALPQAVRRTAARVARSPRLARRLARPAVAPPTGTRRFRGRPARRGIAAGPVRIIIQGN